MRKETPFIGQMDQPILVSYLQDGVSSSGEATQQLVDIATVFSRMEDKSGGLEENEKIIHVNQRVYWIRYRPDVLAQRLKLIITDNGVQYRVYHISEVQRNKFIKITAQVHE